MRRHAAILALLALALTPFAVWASGIANNTGSQLANLVQGPEATGNGGFPFSVVNATGTSLDVNLTGSAVSQTVDQGTPNAGGASSWPIQGYGLDAQSLSTWNLWTTAPLGGAYTPNASSLATSSATFGLRRSGGQQVPVGALAPGADQWVPGNPFNEKALETASAAYLYDPPSLLMSLQRNVSIYKTIATAAAGNTALWTPAGGTRFRLMRYMVTVTDQATQAAPGTITFSLLDGAAGATGQVHDVFVPALGLVNNGSLYSSGWIDLGNGYLSAAANNVLNINLSAALTAGTVRVLCCGTEE